MAYSKFMILNFYSHASRGFKWKLISFLVISLDKLFTIFELCKSIFSQKLAIYQIYLYFDDNV